MTPALQSSIHLHKRYTCMLQNLMFVVAGRGNGFLSPPSLCSLLASILLPCMEMVYMYTQLHIRSY